MEMEMTDKVDRGIPTMHLIASTARLQVVVVGVFPALSSLQNSHKDTQPALPSLWHRQHCFTLITLTLNLLSLPSDTDSIASRL